MAGRRFTCSVHECAGRCAPGARPIAVPATLAARLDVRTAAFVAIHVHGGAPSTDSEEDSPGGGDESAWDVVENVSLCDAHAQAFDVCAAWGAQGWCMRVAPRCTNDFHGAGPPGAANNVAMRNLRPIPRDSLVRVHHHPDGRCRQSWNDAPLAWCARCRVVHAARVKAELKAAEAAAADAAQAPWRRRRRRDHLPTMLRQ